MKKLSIFLAFVLMFSALLLPVSANAPGDVDGNGGVDAADARLALRIAVGLDDVKAGSPQFAAADVDDSGDVTAADARLILRAAVGLESLKGATPGQSLSSKEIYKMAAAYTFEIRVETDEYSAIGSGFAIDKDGLIVTNYHVVQDANSIQVIDLQGKEYPVTHVVAVDRHVDLAIIRVKGTLTPAKLNTKNYETGDTVYTLGSSSGYTGTFASGVIANASVRLDDYNPGVTYVQTSAPISGGNSGGPLIDEYGRVVGVNTLTDESGQNLNFAIPSSYILALDRSHPMTVAEFSKAEYEYREISIAFGEQKLSIRPGGYAAYALGVVSRQDYTLMVKSSNDNVKVSLTDLGYGYTMLNVVAAGECKNAVVTVYIKEAPSVTCEIRVTVTPSADIGYMGTYGTPDFGAVTGVAPNLSDLTYPELYEEVPYDGTKLLKVARSAAKVRELYEQALTAAGFELADKYSSILNLTETTYIYQCDKTGITVYYVEKVVLGILRSVSISIW